MRNTGMLKALAVAGLTLAGSLGPAFAAPAVATAGVNVRSGPGTGYGVVDVLHRGDRVEVDGCRGSWCFVVKPGPDGWVSRSYLSSSHARVQPRPVPVYPSQPGFALEFNFGNTPPVYMPQPRPPVVVRPAPPRDGHWQPNPGRPGWGSPGRPGDWDEDRPRRDDRPRWDRY